jgi:hypothetical protein
VIRASIDGLVFRVKFSAVAREFFCYSEKGAEREKRGFHATKTLAKIPGPISDVMLSAIELQSILAYVRCRIEACFLVVSVPPTLALERLRLA